MMIVSFFQNFLPPLSLASTGLTGLLLIVQIIASTVQNRLYTPIAVRNRIYPVAPLVMTSEYSTYRKNLLDKGKK